jgi:scyllo-inositol 2-dehydrogenase (NADP+)
MYKAAIIGLGKMGLSHLSIANAHPDIELRCVCDTSRYLLDVLQKYTGVRTYTDFARMLREEELDCLFVATPSKYHADIVGAALQRNLNVFCEKPFALEPEAGYRLAELAERKGLVNQVGYHYRFVASFNEAKRLLDRKLIGNLHHVRVEAYGPVVLRRKGVTWRSQKSEGGGCLFDYACHAIDMTNYLVGRPGAVSGTVLNSVFSDNVDDEIYSTFQFAQGVHGQLATNWSDDSFRKMSLKLSLWGTNGRINVDRQELQLYLRSNPAPVGDFVPGWNVRYTTDLTPPVWFYVRGEEYSAQIDHFVQCMRTGSAAISNFRSASDAVLVASMMRRDALRQGTPIESIAPQQGKTPAQGASLEVRPFERGAAAASGSSDATSLPRRTRGLMQTLFGRSRHG